MTRALSITNINTKKSKTYLLKEVWLAVFGMLSIGGFWIIYGDEKHGKTTIALMLAEMFSTLCRTVYISGEEGLELEFREAMKRANIGSKSKLKFYEYISIAELCEKLRVKRSWQVVFIDNTTVYNDELKNGVVKELKQEFPKVLFVFLSHMEKGEPYLSSSKLIKRYAKAILRVEGLACFVSGRVPGGKVVINEEKAILYHGNEIKE